MDEKRFQNGSGKQGADDADRLMKTDTVGVHAGQARPPERPSNAGTLFNSLLLMVLALLATLLYTSESGETLPQDDPIHYIAAAYNIAKYGVFTRTRADDAEKIEPKYRREPLYPFTLAMALKGFTDVDTYSLDCLLKSDSCKDQRKLMIRVNQGFLFLLYCIVVVAGRRLTGSWFGGYLAMLLLAVGNYYAPSAGAWVFYPEILAALLLLIHSVSLALVVEDRGNRLRWAVISGFALGLLILTKAIFQYWLVLLMFVWLASGLLALRSGSARESARSLTLLVLCGCLVAGGWATRNLVHFGHFAISERAGNILLLRSMFGQMTHLEYRAAYCAWTPGELGPLKRYICQGVPREAFSRLKSDGSDPETFKGMRNRQLSDYETRGAPAGSRERTKIEHGVKNLLVNWDEQAKLVPLFGYRGSWPNTRSLDFHGLQKVPIVERARAWARTLGRYTGLLLIPSLFILGVVVLVKRQWALLIVLMPSFYSFGIHAVATHFLPRYSLPTLPVAAIAVSVILVLLVKSRKSGKAGKT